MYRWVRWHRKELHSCEDVAKPFAVWHDNLRLLRPSKLGTETLNCECSMYVMIDRWKIRGNGPGILQLRSPATTATTALLNITLTCPKYQRIRTSSKGLPLVTLGVCLPGKLRVDNCLAYSSTTAIAMDPVIGMRVAGINLSSSANFIFIFLPHQEKNR